MSPERRRTARGSTLTFVLLVFALSVPFWALGAVTGLQLLEGLPVSALMAVCPLVAAAILTYRNEGVRATRALLARSFDHERIRRKRWYLPILLLAPAVMALSIVVMHALGSPVPEVRISVLATLGMFVAFFVAAIGEEVGWSGYATDRLLTRWSALHAGILLGLVWAIWHAVPYTQAHQTPTWIAWQMLDTVATRVLLVWLYVNTGRSVFAACVFHAVGNVCVFSLPSAGLRYDPRVTGLITTLVAAIITIVWGPRTLARLGRARGVTRHTG
ncbi:MAG TPA: type II CAAX endopeptidase family protein [Gemmatimonadaceae bacterium]|nr:type II CAAX endopeptidase family protein [Gemmatimonadaceae bacterium]